MKMSKRGTRMLCPGWRKGRSVPEHLDLGTLFFPLNKDSHGCEPYQGLLSRYVRREAIARLHEGISSN